MAGGAVVKIGQVLAMAAMAVLDRRDSGSERTVAVIVHGHPLAPAVQDTFGVVPMIGVVIDPGIRSGRLGPARVSFVLGLSRQ